MNKNVLTRFCLFCVAVGTPVLSWAVTPLQAKEAYEYFNDPSKLGGLSCAAHMGPNQCRSPKRCFEVLSYVKALSSGLPSAAEDLAKKMGSSSMNKNCGYSLLGGNVSATFKNYSNLYEFAKEYGSRADSEIRKKAVKKRRMAIAMAYARGERKGAYAWAKKKTLGEAKKVALSNCNDKYGNCKLSKTTVGTKKQGCLGVARSSDNALYMVSRSTSKSAHSAALENCNENKQGCKIRVVKCNF